MMNGIYAGANSTNFVVQFPLYEFRYKIIVFINSPIQFNYSPGAMANRYKQWLYIQNRSWRSNESKVLYIKKWTIGYTKRKS